MSHIIDLDRFSSQTTTPQMEIGAKVELPDGRKFRYAKVGGSALVAGHMTQGPAIVADHQNRAVAAAVAIGGRTVTATLGATAATAGQYAGGYLVVNDATGEGHYYKISTNAAADASGVISVELVEPVKVALVASTSEVSLIPNPWNGVIDYPTTSTLNPTGVAPFAVPASSFCLLQTGGPSNVLIDGTVGVMTGIAVPASVAGAVKVMAATLSQVGYALQAGVDTEYNAVFLTID
jgi:hypothetical protein